MAHTGMGVAVLCLGHTIGLRVLYFHHLASASIKVLYRMTSLWFGFIIFAGVVFLAGEMIAMISPVRTSYIAIASLSMAVILSAYAVFNYASGRKSVFIKVLSSKLKDPLRVVLIADTHISGFHRAVYLAGIVAEINRHHPDIVCISGDFADGSTNYSAIEPVNAIQAPVYLVMGNHEVWNNQEGKIETLLNKTKVKILGQSTHNGIGLFGVHFQNRPHALRDGLKEMNIDADTFNILLYHEPKEVAVAQEAGMDLMLCGHTHGGQIFPWNYVTRLAYEHLRGLYHFKDMPIYVSQGTGVWGPPMRLGSSNEITVIDLKPERLI